MKTLENIMKMPYQEPINGSGLGLNWASGEGILDPVDRIGLLGEGYTDPEPMACEGAQL